VRDDRLVDRLAREHQQLGIAVGFEGDRAAVSKPAPRAGLSAGRPHH
jgi:hypothetical protein